MKNNSTTLLLWIVVSFVMPSSLSAQDTLDVLYMDSISYVHKKLDKAESYVTEIAKRKLDAAQKGGSVCLKSRIYWEVLRRGSIEPTSESIDRITFDSAANLGIYYINHGYAAKGLSILYDYVENHKAASDSVIDFLKIKIAEGLRISMDYVKAREILRTVFEKSDITPQNRAWAYNRMSPLFHEDGGISFEQRFDWGVKYSNLAMDIAKQYGFTAILALSQNELAVLYRNKSELLKASENYGNAAMNNFMNAKMYREAMNTSIFLSNIYIKKGQLSNAPRPCLQVLENIPVEGNTDMYMRVYLQLDKAYRLLKDYEKAYHFYDEVRAFEKRIWVQATDDKIKEIAAKYQLVLKENEILKQTEEINAGKRITRYLWFGFLVTSLVFLSVIIILLMRCKSIRQKHWITVVEKEKLHQELKYKNKELVQSLLCNIERNKILKQLKRDIQSDNSDEVLKTINSNIDHSIKWKRVLIDFRRLHPDFITKLSLTYPNLTDRDKNLCALLVLKFTSSEIADIFSISPSSVSKQRQRLRKKMSLPSQADFYAALSRLL